MHSTKFKALQRRLEQLHKSGNKKAVVYTIDDNELRSAVEYFQSGPGKGAVRVTHFMEQSRDGASQQERLRLFETTAQYTAMLMPPGPLSEGLHFTAASHVIFLGAVDPRHIRPAVTRVRHAGQREAQHVVFIANELPLEQLWLQFVERQAELVLGSQCRLEHNGGARTDDAKGVGAGAANGKAVGAGPGAAGAGAGEGPTTRAGAAAQAGAGPQADANAPCLDFEAFEASQVQYLLAYRPQPSLGSNVKPRHFKMFLPWVSMESSSESEAEEEAKYRPEAVADAAGRGKRKNPAVPTLQSVLDSVAESGPVRPAKRARRGRPPKAMQPSGGTVVLPLA